ncbi:amidase [Streptomyces sp. NPDC051173]|uniref:amidase n=1 Tax=Streptomyces sp. NPDC051173 TaxID=3155164 RepID=UPI00344DB0C0
MIRRRTFLTATAGIAATTVGPATAAQATTSRKVASPVPLHLASARDQLAALRHGTITSRQLLEQYLAHHAKANPGINAVVTLDTDGARAAADEADRQHAAGERLGPLHGLPITLKDALETRGLRTTSGNPDLSGHVPSQDADAVARLRAAGAVIMGKTNVPTMCQDIQTSNPLFGRTNNPHATDRTAGGSSGGPAAAVAAGLTALEVGSDLGGSLRLPAAYCGVYALRTSFGTVSARGHIPRLPGWLTTSDMMTLGPVARTADDLELLLDVLAGPAPADAPAWRLDLPAPERHSLGEYRVGLWSDDPYCRVDQGTRDLLEEVAALLRTAGATLDSSTRPVDLADSDKLFQRLMYATSSATAPDDAFKAEARAADGFADDDTSPGAFYLRSRTMRHRDWMRANEERESLRAKWATYFSTHDVLITPATPTAAVPDQTAVPVPQRHITVDGDRRPYFDQTTWANLTSHVRLPSLVVPAGKTADGLPLGIQIIGPYLADRTVIAVARHLAGLLPAPVQPPMLRTAS